MTDIAQMVTLLTHATMFFGGTAFGALLFMSRLKKRPKTTKDGTYSFTPKND